MSESVRWHYVGSPITDSMRNFIIKTLNDKLDTIRLDGGEENITIRIQFSPVNNAGAEAEINHISPHTHKRPRRAPP
jgi:hypothetical protein